MRRAWAVGLVALSATALVGAAQAQQGAPSSSSGRYVFQFQSGTQLREVWVGDTATGQAWICTTATCSPMALPTLGRPRTDCIPAPPPGFKITDPNAVICK